MSRMEIKSRREQNAVTPATNGESKVALPSPKSRAATLPIIQPLPIAVWGAAGLCAAMGLFTPNPALTSVAILVLPILVSLLWFPGEPPALLFACFMQWLQAAVAIFYTDAHGVSLQESFGGPQLYQATWLSLLGVVTLAVGMKVMLLRPRAGTGEAARRDALSIRMGALFAMYLVTYVGLYILNRFTWSFGGFQQPISALGSLRWAMVFLVAYTALAQKRHYGILLLVAVIEFVTGLLGFFSGFKSVFLVLLVVLPTAGYLFRGTRLLQFGILAGLVLAFLLIWTAIKQDYREYLNQGSGQQVILVSVPQRIDKLMELVENLDGSSAGQAFDALVLRVSYVNFFALTIGHVPSSVPHENGNLWFGAIKHVLMPRMFFPDKPVINDSERTIYYSGVQVAGAEEGTSISIGYLGESYIDFGFVGMFVPVFILGMFYGFIYRYFVYWYRFKLVGFALAAAILIFGAYNVETSNIKLVGGNLMVFLVFALCAKIVVPYLWPMITGNVIRSPGNRGKQRLRPRPRVTT
jgi:hypothetical protein